MSKETIIRAMGAAGYTYDELESSDNWVRFFYDFGTVSFDNWDEVNDWLNGVVFDDHDTAEKVEKILREGAIA